MADSLEHLVAQAFTRRGVGPRCWAEELDGEGREFLAAVERRIAAGARPNVRAVTRILRERYGLVRGEHVVGRHLRGDCACRQISTA